MDTQQWIDAFGRTKREEGPMEATRELITGLRRELQSRLKRRKPKTLEGVGNVLVEVERMWLQVDRAHPKTLRSEGFRESTYMGDDSFEEALEAAGALEELPSLSENEEVSQ